MIVLRLIRWRLALLNGVSAMSGYLLFPSAIEVSPLLAALGGTALLASAGSAFNQVLERDIDSQMERTKDRPLPTGAMTVQAALLIGTLALLFGLLWLGMLGGAPALIPGAAALIWYLAVYTPLKRRTSLALLLGAICGALAPMIGWALAGGALTDHRILLLAGLMFLWQVPHFWLLQRRHQSDYQAVGMPLLSEGVFEKSGTSFFALWLVALSVGAMLLPLFGIVPQQRGLFCLLFLLPTVIPLFLRTDKSRYICINMFPLLLTIAIWFMTTA